MVVPVTTKLTLAAAPEALMAALLVLKLPLIVTVTGVPLVKVIVSPQPRVTSELHE